MQPPTYALTYHGRRWHMLADPAERAPAFCGAGLAPFTRTRVAHSLDGTPLPLCRACVRRAGARVRREARCAN